MCTGSNGISGKDFLRKIAGLGVNGAALSSGGYDGGGAIGAGVTKSALSQRRKAARLPIVPLLGQSGEDVLPTAR